MLKVELDSDRDQFEVIVDCYKYGRFNATFLRVMWFMFVFMIQWAKEYKS